MVHATAWDRGRYRNRYVAGPDTDTWPTLVGLVKRGLMRVRFGPSPDLNGMSVFEVTGLGMYELAVDDVARREGDGVKKSVDNELHEVGAWLGAVCARLIQPG